MILASSLNGWDHALGTVTLHSYNESSVDEGEPLMGAGYDDKLRPLTPETRPGSRADEDYSEDDVLGRWAI